MIVLVECCVSSTVVPQPFQPPNRIDSFVLCFLLFLLWQQLSTGPHRRSSDEVFHAPNVPSRSLGKVVRRKGRRKEPSKGRAKESKQVGAGPGRGPLGGRPVWARQHGKRLRGNIAHKLISQGSLLMSERQRFPGALSAGCNMQMDGIGIGSLQMERVVGLCPNVPWPHFQSGRPTSLPRRRPTASALLIGQCTTAGPLLPRAWAISLSQTWLSLQQAAGGALKHSTALCRSFHPMSEQTRGLCTLSR